MKNLKKINGTAFAGVCAGIAYWSHIPVWVVRLLWLIALFYYGVGLGIYILLAICMPRWKSNPPGYHELEVD